MAYKVLEQNGVTNENVDGAGFNYFASGKRDGILGGILSECAVYSPASNIVSIGTGVISVQGFRVKITSDISWAVSGNADEYSIIFEIILNPDRSVSSQFIAQSSSLNLVKDDLLVTEKGTHQIEVIRFTWDGDAVSNISRRLPVIIAGSGGGGVSIELAQDVEGDSTEKAVSQKAVKDALAGKVDKITDNCKAYTTDGSGKTVAKQLAAEPSAGAVVLYNEGGIVKTNAPVEDNDAATKQYVDDGFLEQSTEAWMLYGTGPMNEATGKAVCRMVKATAIGTSDGYVANFRPVGAKDFDYDPSIFKCTLGVCDPQKPMQVANKRYVDDTVDKATANIREAAVGTLYTTQQVHNMNEKAPIPTGALPYAYLEHVDKYCMVGSRDYDGNPTMVGQAEVLEIRQTSDMSSELATMPPTIGQYFKLEDGATHLYLVLGDVEFFDSNNTYYNEFFVNTSVLYQVKVGG